MYTYVCMYFDIIYIYIYIYIYIIIIIVEDFLVFFNFSEIYKS